MNSGDRPNVWIYGANQGLGGGGGFKRYVKQLWTFLPKYSDEIGVVSPDVDPSSNAIQSPVSNDYTFASIFNWLHLSYAARRVEMPLIHFPAQYYAFNIPGIDWSPSFDWPGVDSYVMTIHDLAFLYSSQDSLRSTAVKIREEVNKLDQIITISEKSKADIVEFFDVNTDCVKVIHHSVDRSVFNETQNDQHLISDYGVEPPYVFHLSAGQPRKNVDLIVEGAYSAESSVNLVLAGGISWEDLARYDAARQLRSEGRLRIIGEHVTDYELAALYHNAVAFLLPSDLEGFGYPAVEAMSCGTHVVVSNKPPFREIVGDAGEYVDPDCPVDLGRTIDELSEADDINSQGIERVKELFSTERFAKAHLSVYEDILQ
jgi:glycosyltransferase involved in cell wall biosynthesis